MEAYQSLFDTYKELISDPMDFGFLEEPGTLNTSVKMILENVLNEIVNKKLLIKQIEEFVIANKRLILATFPPHLVKKLSNATIKEI